MRHSLVALALLGALACTGSAAEEKRIPSYPRVAVETSHGDFVLQLDTRRAPISVRNFLRYVDEGFYEGTVFHRVIEGFMAQAGGYDQKLLEKPTHEAIPNESGNGISNVRGTVAMARTGDPHSATAQFFINLVDNARLDPGNRNWGYAVFGEVIEGMETLDTIAALPTGDGGLFSSDVPKPLVVLEKVRSLD